MSAVQSTVYTTTTGAVAHTPAQLNAYEIVRDFAVHLSNLFETVPARVIHDEYQTPEYVWTNVTVALPRIGEAAYSVDSRREGPDALRLYLDNKPVPFTWTEGLNVGWMLARAIPGAVQTRDAEATTRN